MRQSELQRLFRELRLWIAIPAVLLLLFSYGTVQAEGPCQVNGYVMALIGKSEPGLPTHDQKNGVFVFVSPNPSRTQWYVRSDVFAFYTRNHSIVTLTGARIQHNVPIYLSGWNGDPSASGCGSGPGVRWAGEIFDSIIPW
ncbi:MAG: hypothetical protein ACRD98_00620 [Nitrososphaera sp.]